MMHTALLSQRGLIKIFGDDTVAFLQGLVTNDVARVAAGQIVYAALLTPQGKFLHDFFLMPWQGGILLDCDRTRLTDLHQRLLMYKLRSKVTIESMEQLAVAAAWGEGTPDIPQVTSFADPRYAPLGLRLVGEASGLRTVAADAGEYDAMRLALGVPDGARDMTDKSLLLEFGFEDLHGVDFRKGCYVGQEVTARTKHRATLRRFIYQLQGEAPLPAPATPVYAGDVAIGEMCSSAGNTGLALLRVAELEKAQKEGTPLRAGEVAILALLAPWVSQPPKALSLPE